MIKHLRFYCMISKAAVLRGCVGVMIFQQGAFSVQLSAAIDGCLSSLVIENSPKI